MTDNFAVRASPTAQSVSSVQISPQYQEIYDGSSLVDVLTLIVDFLERSTNLKETAATLRDEVQSKGILPPSVSWNGESFPGRLLDYRSLHLLPKDALLRALLQLQSRASQPISAPAFPTPTGIVASTMKALMTESKNAIESKQRRAQKKNGQSPSKDLLDLRLQRRQLIRELQSDRGRSSNHLINALSIINAKIQTLARALVLIPQLRRDSGCNVIDALTSPKTWPAQISKASSINKITISGLKMLKKMFAHREAAFCASASNSKWLFTGADDNAVKMWNAQNARLHYSFRGHKNVITDISSTDELIASASEDSSVFVWEMGSTRPFVVFTQHKQPVQRVQFSNDGSVLFTSAEDGACCVWNIDALKLQVNDKKVSEQAWIEREKERRRHAALNPTNGSNQLQLTLEQQELQMLLECPRNPVIFDPPLVFPHCGPSGEGSKIVKIVCMAVHPSGKFVATGAEDCLGRVWSVDEISAQPAPPAAATLPELINGDYRDGSAHLLCTLSGHTAGYVHHIEWSHAGDRILTFSDKDGTARIWFWPLGDFASKPQHIALKAIVSSSSNNLTNTKPANRAGTKMMPMVDGAGFSKDDKFVITTQSVKPAEYKGEEPGFWDSRVCVWDAKSGSLLRFMRGHRAQVNVVRMHPELDFIAATCGADGLMIFWDVSTGEELNRIEASSQWGHGSILDARWSVNQDHPCEFIATDSIGRLLLIGHNAPSTFEAAPPAQFFSYEMETFIADSRTNEPMDATLQIPLYLMTTPPLLVNYQIEPYEHQPPPIPKGEGSFFGPPQKVKFPDNYKQRIEQAQKMERDMEVAETQFYLQNKHLIEKQDEAILTANERDREEQIGNTSSITLSAKTQRVYKPKSAQPKLKYEREVVDLEVEEDEEDDDEDDETNNGRSRRAAARRATRQIHRHARILGESGANGDERNDPTFAGNRTRHDDDDDEEEDSLESEDDDDDDDDDDEDSYGRAYAAIPRKVYETRKKNRPNYSQLENDDDDDFEEHRSNARNRRKYSDDDDALDEDSHVERRPSRGVQGRPPRSTTAATSTQIAVICPAFSDDWLTYTQSPSSYVPQVGDAVVYFPQGHAEYLQHFPSTDSPPWQAWNGKEWPYVCCKVMDIQYQFPEKDEPVQILCKVTLKVTHVKGGQSASLVQLPQRVSPIEFSVLYHSFEPEFLVLLDRFLAGLKQGLKPGDPIRCFSKNLENPMEPNLISAIVKDIQVRNTDEWPDSPWECLVCTSLVSGEEGSQEEETLWVSPWDAELDTDATDTVPLWSITSKETFAFRSKSVGENDQLVGEYIADQMEDCPLWSAFRGTSRRKSGLPCLVNMSLVTERLRGGNYYRQFEAIAFDLRMLVECCLFGTNENHPLRKKAPRFLAELTEIINIAKNGSDWTPTSSNTIHIASLPDSIASITASVRVDILRTTLMEAVELVAAEDKEEFFAEPVDLNLFPDYTQYVDHPMDYKTIKDMIQSHSFEASVSFLTRGTGDKIPIHVARAFVRNVIHDVRLVSDNAMRYNMEGSMAFRRAKECWKKMTQVFGELDLESLENRPSFSVSISGEAQRGRPARGQTIARMTSSGRPIKAPTRADGIDPDASGADSLLNDDSADDDDVDSEASSGSEEETEKRGRGRPKGSKNKSTSKRSTLVADNFDIQEQQMPNAGYPKRLRVAAQQQHSDDSVLQAQAFPATVEPGRKGRRGRPRKNFINYSEDHQGEPVHAQTTTASRGPSNQDKGSYPKENEDEIEEEEVLPQRNSSSRKKSTSAAHKPQSFEINESNRGRRANQRVNYAGFENADDVDSSSANITSKNGRNAPIHASDESAINRKQPSTSSARLTRNSHRLSQDLQSGYIQPNIPTRRETRNSPSASTTRRPPRDVKRTRTYQEMDEDDDGEASDQNDDEVEDEASDSDLEYSAKRKNARRRSTRRR